MFVEPAAPHARRPWQLVWLLSVVWAERWRAERMEAGLGTTGTGRDTCLALPSRARMVWAAPAPSRSIRSTRFARTCRQPFSPRHLHHPSIRPCILWVIPEIAQRCRPTSLVGGEGHAAAAGAGWARAVDGGGGGGWALARPRCRPLAVAEPAHIPRWRGGAHVWYPTFFWSEVQMLRTHTFIMLEISRNAIPAAGGSQNIIISILYRVPLPSNEGCGPALDITDVSSHAEGARRRPTTPSPHTVWVRVASTRGAWVQRGASSANEQTPASNADGRRSADDSQGPGERMRGPAMPMASQDDSQPATPTVSQDDSQRTTARGQESERGAATPTASQDDGRRPGARRANEGASNTDGEPGRWTTARGQESERGGQQHRRRARTTASQDTSQPGRRPADDGQGPGVTTASNAGTDNGQRARRTASEHDDGQRAERTAGQRAASTTDGQRAERTAGQRGRTTASEDDEQLPTAPTTDRMARAMDGGATDGEGGSHGRGRGGGQQG
ncbi:hypothetical protein BJ912DRAFT_1109440 [Pholiota molesta]|nr:hypothetical protein BJ912DRAFT_1109440 [Pholiota molesta]